MPVTIACSTYLFDPGLVHGCSKLHHDVVDLLVSPPGVLARLHARMQFYLQNNQYILLYQIRKHKSSSSSSDIVINYIINASCFT
jgi:hypothetical protein